MGEYINWYTCSADKKYKVIVDKRIKLNEKTSLLGKDSHLTTTFLYSKFRFSGKEIFVFKYRGYEGIFAFNGEYFHQNWLLLPEFYMDEDFL